jgi:putative ABC transport system permease protein
VLGEGTRLIAAGVAIGLLGGTFMTTVVASVLPVVDAIDPIASGVAVVVLACVALTASYLPARAAAAVDPLVALRSE